MKRLWHRGLASLTPGARGLLGVLAVVYLAAVAGRAFHAVDLEQWLGLSGPRFWSGQIWRIVTFALLPVGILDFLMNGLMIAWVGSLLERVWARGELWTYALVATGGAGLTRVLLLGSSPALVSGAEPLVFGLLVASAWLLGHERVSFFILGEMTIRQLALLAGAINFGMMWYSSGLITAVVMVSGGLAGWLYLWLRGRLLMEQKSRVVHSERISRLEL